MTALRKIPEHIVDRTNYYKLTVKAQLEGAEQKRKGNGDRERRRSVSNNADIYHEIIIVLNPANSQ
ncbi:hypothetical protein L798_00873 [Zootermopsis nevadensis]|uniref:Uncharacterized protein n=1 Tax=Zootermopsis nevadensis TaxID=136037 RepID=A0A067QTL8_ZOONE|nr:hypothetical protein L798_00873 [Zootermopsis nevadensis]